MTTTTFSHAFGSLSGPGGSAALALASRIHARLIRGYRMRRDRRALRAMPDHILRDIGISRGEIDSALLFGRDRRPQ